MWPLIPLQPTKVGIERQTSSIPYSPFIIVEIVKTESVLYLRALTKSAVVVAIP